jgi:hypothetical protein
MNFMVAECLWLIGKKLSKSPNFYSGIHEDLMCIKMNVHRWAHYA